RARAGKSRGAGVPEPSEGAAISSTPPPIHATVPACQTSRIRVRKRSGWMVAFANTLVSPSTPWMIATRIAAAPAHCIITSRIDEGSIQYCMDMSPRLAAVNTLVYGGLSQDGNMGDQLSAQDWLDPGAQTAGEKRL